MAEIIDGKELAQKTRDSLRMACENLKSSGIYPKLAVIMVGDDPSSKVYVKNKSRACDEVGIAYEEYLLPESTTQFELLSLIQDLNGRDDVNGILLQSPIAKHLNINEAFRAINPRKDVDGFHPLNVGKLTLGQDTFVSCTAYGVMRMLEEYNIKKKKKNVVILGRSNIVGKPLIQCCLNKNATVTVCHSKTADLKEYTQRADIIIIAIGKPRFLTEDMVKEGAVVIDVGINKDKNNKLCGDVDFDKVKKKASYITPVPGGVGPMTVAMLMNNVLKAARNQPEQF